MPICLHEFLYLSKGDQYRYTSQLLVQAMANTYQIGINQCESKANTGEIFVVHYDILAVDETNEYTERFYSDLSLDNADPETMIPYSDVTEQQLITWVEEKLTTKGELEAIYENLDNSINNQKKPKILKGLPWSGHPPEA